MFVINGLMYSHSYISKLVRADASAGGTGSCVSSNEKCKIDFGIAIKTARGILFAETVHEGFDYPGIETCIAIPENRCIEALATCEVCDTADAKNELQVRVYQNLNSDEPTSVLTFR